MGFQWWPHVWVQSRAELALDRAGLDGALCAPCCWLTHVCPGASGEQPPSGFYEPGLCTPFLPARETFTPPPVHPTHQARRGPITSSKGKSPGSKGMTCLLNGGELVFPRHASCVSHHCGNMIHLLCFNLCILSSVFSYSTMFLFQLLSGEVAVR